MKDEHRVAVAATRQRLKEMIDRMPERGLEEIQNTLQDAIEFYSHEIQPIILPSRKNLLGIIVAKTERHQLVLVDDC